MKKLYATFLIIACTLVSLPCNAQAEWKNDFSKQGETLKNGRKRKLCCYRWGVPFGRCLLLFWKSRVEKLYDVF